jgi:hypothetical protein
MEVLKSIAWELLETGGCLLLLLVASTMSFLGSDNGGFVLPAHAIGILGSRKQGLKTLIFPGRRLHRRCQCQCTVSETTSAFHMGVFVTASSPLFRCGIQNKEMRVTVWTHINPLI